MRPFKLELLGGFRITCEGQPVTDFPTVKTRALLAYLAVKKSPQQRDVLADLLWPKLSTKRALRNLTTTLSKLRKVLKSAEITGRFTISDNDALKFFFTENSEIGFDPNNLVSVDVNQFEELLATGCQAHTEYSESCTECIERLKQAVELYQGDLLAGFFVNEVPFEEWLVIKQEELKGQALEALTHLTEYHLQQSKEQMTALKNARSYARRQLELDSWRQKAHRQLMRALALSGERDAALKQYETCCEILNKELGVEPTAETTALYEQIRDNTLEPIEAYLPASPSPASWPPKPADREVNVTNALKITMLGPSGCGKTCYMLGMYAYMQFGINGLTLSAEDLDEDIRLSELWYQLVDVKDNTRWPPPNDNNPKTYTFDCNYGFQPMMQFEWLDYRGGAMSDYSTEADVEILTNQLTNSSCVFLCVSGEYLTEPLADQVARVAKIDRMNRLMARIGHQVRPTPQRPFPVVIILTKYDLCSHRAKKEIIADIKRLFQALFAAGSGWLTMISLVSLGMELAKNQNAGAIEPIDVHPPIVFAIYTKWREYGLNLKSEESDSRSNVENLQKGFLRRLLQSGDIAQGSQRLKELEGQIDEIETNMRRLAQELRHTQIFLGGKEIQIG